MAKLIKLIKELVHKNGHGEREDADGDVSGVGHYYVIWRRGGGGGGTNIFDQLFFVQTVYHGNLMVAIF